MLVVNKKRIYLVLSCILVLVGILNFGGINKNNKSVVETVALPVSNRVIVLDAGHGKPDERRRK